MRPLITILSLSLVGFFSIWSKNQTPQKPLINSQEVTPTAIAYTSTSAQYQNQSESFTKQLKGIERLSELSKNIPESNYRPDNNPVTYDENPANYPLYKPKTYTNTYDQEVQSPTHYNAIPEGACAVCRDGSYSFSRNRRGTCSHHGGVAKWLK